MVKLSNIGSLRDLLPITITAFSVNYNTILTRRRYTSERIEFDIIALLNSAGNQVSLGLRKGLLHYQRSYP